MKKTFAIILSLVMLVCCIPFASAADIVIFEESAPFFGDGGVLVNPDGSAGQLASGITYEIPSGVTMTVPSGYTLFIPSGSTLVVDNGGKLVIYGTVVVLDGGLLKIDGFINGASNVTVNGDGTAMAAIRFPALSKTAGLIDSNGNPRITVSVGSSSNGNIYEDLDGTVTFKQISEKGETYYANLNQYLYIRAVINEPDKTYDKYDDSLMNVYINGVGIPYTQGSHHTMLTTSGDISYSKWVNDDMFLNTFNIYLPTGEGYTVYGREGEQSADGETVKLKYGQSFSFKVEIDPEYDMSAYEVYIYNGYGWTNLDTSTLLKDIAPAEPDEYGYYHIGKDSGGIKGEHTIYVVGVVKNETLLMVGDILDMIRNVFEMISGFFAELMSFLGLSTGGGTTIA